MWNLTIKDYLGRIVMDEDFDHEKDLRILESHALEAGYDVTVVERTY